MTNKSSYTVVGAFVLVLGAVFIWGVLWISAGGPPQRFDHYLVYMLESVSGLNVDSPLKYRGVDVGKIEQISIDLENPERIRLLLQVQQGTPITADTVATLEYQGLTGIANINLSGGRPGSPPLGPTPGEDYPVITTRPSLFARLDATISHLLENLTTTSANINALLNDENRASVSRSIENVATITDSLADQSGELENITSNLVVTLENVRAASASLPQLMERFSESADAIAGMAEQIQSIGDSVAAVSDDIQHVVTVSGADLEQFTGATLPDVAATAFELRLASENLRRMSEALAQDPSILLYGRPEPGAGPGERSQ